MPPRSVYAAEMSVLLLMTRPQTTAKTSSGAVKTKNWEQAEVATKISEMASAVAAHESTADLDDPEVRYAVKFLTYASAIPFRRLAVAQELSDVFEFSGTFDAAFLARWNVLSPTERAAFSQSYRELRRLEALENGFADASQESTEDATLEERASRYVAAHLDGLEAWQNTLRYEAHVTDFSKVTPSLLAEGDTIGAAPEVDGSPVSSSLVAQIVPGGNRDVHTVLESLAPIDGLAQTVLEHMCSAEIKEAQGRFLNRVRWMLGLPNPQRIAVALRTAGKKRREIAIAMSVTDDAVKTYLNRADDDWAKLLEAQKAPSVRGRAKA